MFQFNFSGSRNKNLHATDKEACVTEDVSASLKPFTELYPDSNEPGPANTTKHTFCLESGEEITYVSASDVEKWLLQCKQGCEIVGALEKHSDLEAHIYEGGLKVWECSLDLVRYLEMLSIQWKELKVLELGCGAGLPGLFALRHGAQVHFQDYNEEVVKFLTIPNATLNTEQDGMCRCRFFAGDWSHVRNTLLESLEKEDDKYDVMLTSETIYSPESYDKLLSVMTDLLKKDGAIYLAAKTCYFGVGGGTTSFLEHVENDGHFRVEHCGDFSSGVQREILKLTRIKSRIKSSIPDTT